MSLRGQRVRFEPIRSIAFGSVSGSYAAVGTALANASRLLMFDNLLNAAVLISFDGVHDHMFIAASSSKVIDLSTNRVGPVDQLELSEGTIIYVKQASGAPGSGTLYVSTLYASIN
jgi:hypothetical protein